MHIDDIRAYAGVATWLTPHDPAAAAVLERAERRPCADRRPSHLPSAPRTAGPNGCLPRGPLGHEPDADVVLAHSFVSPEAYAVLATEGAVGPEFSHVFRDEDDRDVRPAYDWLRWRMLRTVEGFTGGYPMWMWVRTTRRALVDSARSYARSNPGSVLLTLRVPRAALLMTDHVEWTSVLNGCPGLPATCPACATRRCRRWDCFDDWFDAWGDAWDARIPHREDGRDEPWWHWPAAMQAELFGTWDEACDPTGSRSVQACADVLRAEWVVDAVVPRRGGDPAGLR